jgi:hypothetical protein
MPAPVGTATEPLWRFTVAGVVVDWKEALIEFDELQAILRDGDAMLEFHVVGGPLDAIPDPYLGKSIKLEADWGDGWKVLFNGRCTRNPTRFQDKGWLQSYSCKGLTYLANRVPVSNPIDGTDAIVFNAPSTEFDYLPQLAARTVGYMLRYVLDTPASARRLSAYGVGGYTATIGSGATATVSLSGVVTIVDGGDGYDAATPPNAVLVGGDGTYTSIAVSVDGSGHVTGATISGFADYTITPEIWISCLPVATLKSFAPLALIPQSPQTVHGERIFDGLKYLVHQCTNNHALIIDNDGTIRAYDLRTPWSTTTLHFDSATDRVDLPSLSLTRSVEDCFQRAETRGGPEIIPVMVGLKPPENAPDWVFDNGLQEFFGHDGISSNDAKEVWSLNDYTQPGLVTGQASASPSMGTGPNAGKMVAVTTGAEGYGYTPGATYHATIAPPGGSGTTAAAQCVANTTGNLETWSVTNSGSGYVAPPSIRVPSPPGSNFDAGRIVSISPGTSTSLITIQPDDHSKSWPANHYDQSASGRKGTLFGICDAILPGVEMRNAWRVVANTAQVAGATSNVTVEGSVPSGYNSYQMFATAAGTLNVWQLYKFTNNAPYAGKIAQQFPWPVPCLFSDGTGATMTSTPLAWVCHSDNGQEPYLRAQIGITIDSLAGTLRTETPTVVPFGNHDNLVKGGADTDGIPDDVQALLPVIVGNLSAVCPANTGYPATTPAYSGTSHTIEGLSETYTITVPAWIDKANQAQMDLYACDLLDSVKDTIIDGSLRQLRFNGPLLSRFGQALQLSAPVVDDEPLYQTRWDGIAIPILQVTLQWNKPGSGKNKYTTSYHVSNQRDALGADYFVRPTHVGLEIGGGSEGVPMGGFLGGSSSPSWSAPSISAPSMDMEGF